MAEVGRCQARERLDHGKVRTGLTEAARRVALAHGFRGRWAVRLIRATALEVGRRINADGGLR